MPAPHRLSRCRPEDDRLFSMWNFLIDGDDILYLSRTALNQPHNFHDSNYTTFHRIENFRIFLKETT